jgi:uncharacterized protein YecT (DUF1311 family)
MKRLSIALIALSLTCVALGEEAPCVRNAAGVFENISCAVEARDKANKELNSTYQRLLAALSQGEAEKLRQAQRAWLSFVEADAEFVFERDGGGSSGQLVVVNTREQLTRQRNQALKSWLSP